MVRFVGVVPASADSSKLVPTTSWVQTELSYTRSCLFPVRVASTANVNTSAPGTSIDSITLSTGDRVLLRAQSTGSQNGVWIFNGSGSALTRPTDSPTGNTNYLTFGMTVTVLAGSTYAGYRFYLATTGSITVDSTSQTWTQVPNVTAGGGGNPTNGTATIDFGSYPGKNETTVVVTGQTSIASGSAITARFDGDGSVSGHDANDHRWAAALCTIIIDTIVAGTGFTLRIISTEKLEGQFSLKWSWE